MNRVLIGIAIVLGAASCTSTESQGTSTTGGGTATGTTGTATGTTGSSTSGSSGTSTGGSTSGGTSTGGTSGGSDAGCTPPSLGLHEFEGCTNQAACACGMDCVVDPAQFSPKSCEVICAHTADCPDPSTACRGGFCQRVSCGGSGTNGTVGSACAVEQAGDGTCYGAVPQDDTAGWCVRNGTSTGTCLWPSPNATAALTCPAGQICSTVLDTTYYLPLSSASAIGRAAGQVPPGGYFGTCVPICSQTVGCPASQTCALNNLGGTEFGSGCAGACVPGVAAREFETCGTDANCGCDLRCVADPLYAPQMLCERPCQQDSDCPNAGDACQSGSCTHRLCVRPDGQSVNGAALNGPCTVQTAGDGTCVPSYNSTQIASFGDCYLGGTAHTTCDATLPNTAASLCAPGSFCVAGACLTVCDPGHPTCTGGAACIPINFNPASGVCVAP